jgi:hypothetical protein
MDKNNITTAPQVDGFTYFFEKWKRDHVGSEKAFYSFMTTPGTERDEFMNSLGPEVSLDFRSAVAEVTLKKSK